MTLATVTIALGAIFLPLGYYLLLEGASNEYQFVGLIMVMVGGLLLLSAIPIAFHEQTSAKKEKRISDKANDDKFNAINVTLQGILKELSEIRRDNNGKRNTKHKL